MHNWEVHDNWDMLNESTWKLTYIITELTWYICKWLVLNNWDILNWEVHDNWDKNIFSFHFSYNVHTVPTLLNLNVLSLISRVSCFWVFYVRFHFVYLNIVDKHNFANVLWIFEFFAMPLCHFSNYLLMKPWQALYLLLNSVHSFSYSLLTQ